MAGSRSTAPSNRSNSVLIVAPRSAFQIDGYTALYTGIFGTKVGRVPYRMMGAGLSEKQTGVRERQTTVKERGIMKKIKSLARGWIPWVVCMAVISLVAGVPAWAQGEKRTVFAEGDFHWQGSLKAGQTL